ncbi:hypothetical protein PsorP6_000723 [Peronosclerospora sorghi]|uniref:Uncharacterized protein n=1 Tax=Peronosclerospora sorghi TaxID=230839 RepID=A0ACC0WWK0_9STRA|nr:hypothetical protein PsorP6_000723 [Peronosclerospora sorghi]
MRELNMAVLLTLAISANNPALSTSVGTKLAEVARDRDTLAPDEGKRSLRVKEKTVETLEEDRMEGPPALKKLVSKLGRSFTDSRWILLACF